MSHTVSFHLFSVSLDIFNHQVFSAKLVVIWKMVDELIIIHSYRWLDAEEVLQIVHSAPVKIPISIF